MEYTYSILDLDNDISLNFQELLNQYKDFFCVSIASTPLDALNAVLQHKPDVVFIFLNEKAAECFHMVSELHQYVEIIPLIIGISNTKDYAYNAIKNNFFDYLIAPFNDFEVRKSIFRIKKKSPKEIPSQTICLKSYQDYSYINTDEILYLKADNNATDFILRNGNIISAFKTLKTFECGLPSNFIRIHQSYILNCNHVAKISFGKGLCILKCNQEKIPFSKSYRKNVEFIKGKLTDNTIFALN